MASKKDLTKNVLCQLYSEGLSDAAIGDMFGMTGEGVAYRRKKYGIVLENKNTDIKKAKKKLESASRDELFADYYNFTVDQFSQKYGVSKTVWKPYLKSLGVEDKNTKRINSYPPLTLEQKRWIVGGMLGDGGISKDFKYYEFHSFKQEKYLRRKHLILRPYSKEVKPSSDGTGLTVSTVSHPVFKEFREAFYKDGVLGKNIPVEFIRPLWGDEILACWYFDDGCIDDTTGDVTISNKCPNKSELYDLVFMINEKYRWNINVGTQGPNLHRLYFPRSCLREFGDILLRFSSSDLYYKIPEQSLPKKLVVSLDTDKITPKIYRSSDGVTKKKIENKLFNHYREKGFPYATLSEDRLRYVTRSFLERVPKESGGIIEHNTAGLSLCEYFFPNIYEASRQKFDSPRKLWDSDEFLRKLVENRLRYSNRINDASMRRGIKLSKYCVSNFKPMIALFLYGKYCKSGKVFDYSAGFGSRMLAAMSMGLHYHACEPSEKTYRNLEIFGDYLRKEIGGNFTLHSSGSEDFDEGSFDFIFSSPPYFDFEKYSDDPGQSIVKYPEYEVWLNNYWRSTIHNASTMLTDDGRFGVCLSPYCRQGILETTISIAEEEGLFFERDYKCPFKQVLGGPDKYEVVLVFSKRRSNSKVKFNLRCKDGSSEDAFKKDLVKHVKVYSEDEYKAAMNLFLEKSKELGLSRDTYKDRGVIGIPIHVIEHHFGGWNAFIRACGLEPGYEAKSSADRVREYFAVCDDLKKAVSFYEYEKHTGNPSSRLKRLFNKGKKYHHLKERLFEAAVDVQKRVSFLESVSD